MTSPHPGRRPGPGPVLRLPRALTPAARDLPACGWVLARGFTPAWAAPALWAPYTGQAAAALAVGALATTRTSRARAVAVLHPPSPGVRVLLAAGLLGGMAALYGAILSLALAYLTVLDVRTPLAAAPAYLLAVWPVAAGLALAWPARHNLLHRHHHRSGAVRVGSLAARPRGRRAGVDLLHQLGDAADAGQVTLALTARTGPLVGFYTAAGYTRPDPTRRWMNRTPTGRPDHARQP